MKRVATGLVLAATVLLVVKRAPAAVVWVAIAIVALLAADEVRRILCKLGKSPWPAITFAGTLGIVAAFVVDSPPVVPVLAAVLLLAWARAFVPTQEPAAGVDRVLGTLLVVLYVGLTLGHIVGLFTFGQDELARRRGEDLTVLLLGVVYLGDTMAMYGGKLFGKHKMAPGISPAKTWEGAASGILGSVAFAFFARATFFGALPLVHTLVLGIVVGAAGIAGDLSESLLKRAAAVKDSGTLLPGHGGMLDRIDSLLLAAPVVYWYHRLLLLP